MDRGCITTCAAPQQETRRYFDSYRCTGVHYVRYRGSGSVLVVLQYERTDQRSSNATVHVHADMQPDMCVVTFELEACLEVGPAGTSHEARAIFFSSSGHRTGHRRKKAMQRESDAVATTQRPLEISL